jgi:hypothetical protein
MQSRCRPSENIPGLVDTVDHEINCRFREDPIGTIKLQDDLIVNFNDLFNGEIGHGIFICVPVPCKASA